MESTIQPAPAAPASPAPSPVQVALRVAQEAIVAIQARMTGTKEAAKYIKLAALLVTLTSRIRGLARAVAEEAQAAREAERQAQREAAEALRDALARAPKPLPIRYARLPKCIKWGGRHAFRKRDNTCYGCAAIRVPLPPEAPAPHSETESGKP